MGLIPLGPLSPRGGAFPDERALLRHCVPPQAISHTHGEGPESRSSSVIVSRAVDGSSGESGGWRGTQNANTTNTRITSAAPKVSQARWRIRTRCCSFRSVVERVLEEGIPKIQNECRATKMKMQRDVPEGVQLGVDQTFRTVRRDGDGSAGAINPLGRPHRFPRRRFQGGVSKEAFPRGTRSWYVLLSQGPAFCFEHRLHLSCPRGSSLSFATGGPVPASLPSSLCRS